MAGGQGLEWGRQGTHQSLPGQGRVTPEKHSQEVPFSTKLGWVRQGDSMGPLCMGLRDPGMEEKWKIYSEARRFYEETRSGA